MSKLAVDTVRAILIFIGQSAQFIVGLLGVVLVTALSLSGEILDDIANYQTPVDWGHVAKVVVPPCGVAMAAYIQHRRLVDQALSTPPPAENDARAWSATEASQSGLFSRERQRRV